MTEQESDRGYITWTPNKQTKTEVDQLLTVINSYKARNLPAPTARDLYYDMIAIYGHRKAQSVNRKIYRLLRKMRRSRKIGFDAIPIIVRRRGLREDSIAPPTSSSRSSATHRPTNSTSPTASPA